MQLELRIQTWNSGTLSDLPSWLPSVAFWSLRNWYCLLKCFPKSAFPFRLPPRSGKEQKCAGKSGPHRFWPVFRFQWGLTRRIRYCFRFISLLAIKVSQIGHSNEQYKNASRRARNVAPLDCECIEAECYNLKVKCLPSKHVSPVSYFIRCRLVTETAV